MKLSRSLAVLSLLALPVQANDLCEGNGYGGAYIDVGPGYLGGFFSVDLGSPAAPSSFVILSISDGADHTVHPVLGPVCLDVFSPVYDIIVLPTDGTGNLHFDVFLPAIPTWVTLPPFYANAVTFEGGQWSSSKTIPLYFENANSWTPVAPMSEPRMYHTATNLGADGKDDRIKILVAGGGAGVMAIPAASATTEIFDPLTRSFTAGPTMMVERANHTATRLMDGRVLLAGGLDDSGVCHSSCEIYDRATDTLTPTGSMTAPRAGHTATLLDDGRVLVTGGFADYQNPQTDWAAALSSAQNTAEIYDPITGTWTATAGTMAAKRGGHTATKLPDGKVLIVNGIVGGGIGDFLAGTIVPFFTPTVDLFDPATGTFTAVANLTTVFPLAPATGRALHGASLLADGRVLVCGGVFSGGSYGEAISTNDCQVWDGTAWTLAAPLPGSAALLNQITLENGDVLVAGGLAANGFDLSPKAFTGLHFVDTLTGLGGIGLNPGLPGGGTLELRGGMTATPMHDGSALFLGGTVGDTTGEVLATGYVYTPAP